MERLAHDPEVGARNGAVRVRVADDAMAAFLQVLPPEPGGRAVTLADALLRLEEAGVVYGIDSGAVARAVDEASGEWVAVAAGRPPQPGADAQVTYHPALAEVGGRPRVRPDGRVDLFDLGLVRSVTAGTVVATKVPATPGTPGTDVLGREVPARPGRDVPLRGAKAPRWLRTALPCRPPSAAIRFWWGTAST